MYLLQAYKLRWCTKIDKHQQWTSAQSAHSQQRRITHLYSNHMCSTFLQIHLQLKQQQHRLPTATSQIFSCLFQNCKSVQSNGGCVILESATDQPTIHKRRTQFTQTTTSTQRRWFLGKCAPAWTSNVHQPLICRSTSAHYKQYSPAIVLFNLVGICLDDNQHTWQSTLRYPGNGKQRILFC